MRILPLFLLLIVPFSACDGRKGDDRESRSETAAGTSNWPATTKTDGGGYAITVEPTTSPIVRNKHFSLSLTVKSENEQPGPLRVLVDADMPAHKHGMNTQPELVDLGDGRYRVDGMLFHMSGYWEIMIDVTAAGKTERATVAVTVDKPE